MHFYNACLNFPSGTSELNQILCKEEVDSVSIELCFASSTIELTYSCLLLQLTVCSCGEQVTLMNSMLLSIGKI